MQGVREEGRAWEAAWERPGEEDPAQGSQLPHRSLWLGDSGAGAGGGGAGCAGLWVNRPGIQYGA